MQVFNAIAGQSIWDVCLNTYGSLDYLYKLIQDNGVLNVNASLVSGQVFTWDDTLVINQQVNRAFASSGITYSTDVSSLGSVFYVLTNSGPVNQVPSTPFTPSIPPKITYQMVYNTSYTASANGEITMTPLDINNVNLVGYDIIQIEKDIKPLYANQWSWNKTTGVLTLTNGVSMAAGESLFILYSKIITG